MGNALEGVPEEDEEGEKPKESNVESTENIDGEERKLCSILKRSFLSVLLD